MRATILAIKKKHRKNCTFSVQNIYDFVNLQIKLHLQLKIRFSRTFTNNQKTIIKASTLKTEKLQHNKLKW